MPNRTIRQVLAAKTVIVGGVIPLTKYFGEDEAETFDPLLMLDEFKVDLAGSDSIGGELPWHPHKGQATFTYLIEGGLRHRDTLGNDASVTSGGATWMRASGGLQHQDSWHGHYEHAWAYEMWVNMARADKDGTPAFKAIEADAVPLIRSDDGIVRLLSGRIGETEGPVPLGAGRFFFADITVQPGKSIGVDIAQGDTFCLVPIAGAPRIADRVVGLQSVAVLSDGDRVEIAAGDEAARCLLIGGAPLHEPVVWEGSFVLSSDEDLAKAKADYQAGKYGTPPKQAG